MYGAALVAGAAEQIAQPEDALADAADIEVARAIRVGRDPSRLRQVEHAIVDFLRRRDHCLVRKTRRGPRESVEFSGVEDVLAIGRRVNQLDLRRWSRSERPLQHRANRRNRSALRDEAQFRRGRAIDRESAERSAEIDQVAYLPLE